MASVDLLSPKIKTLEELEALARQWRQSDKKIVLCHGVFDLLHPGHIRHFEAAKKQGDILVITVTADRYVQKGPGRPIFNEELRAYSLASLRFVDYVAISNYPTAKEAISCVRPHFYVKGQEYSQADQDITGGISLEEKVVRSFGGKLIFTNEVTFSSTNLINNHLNIYPTKARSFLGQFRKRYSADQIIKTLRSLKDLRVLVFGETIIDEYYYCQAMGKSPKETIVSTRYISQETFAGGVLATANHVAGFAKEVHLVTCLGQKKSYEPFIREHLKPNVRPKFFYLDTNTIVKRRFVDPAFLTKMFEVSYLDDRPLESKIESSLNSYLKSHVNEYDVVIVSDYGHGLIGPKTVEVLTREAPFLAVNTQANSANHGYNVITKYPRANYVCIDEPEIRLALRDRFGPIKELMLELSQKLRVTNLVVTRGHHGSAALSQNKGFVEVPIFSEKTVDRVGAGDAYFSISSLCAAKRLPLEVICFAGNAAGALAVAIVCNREAVEPVPFLKFINSLLK